MTNVWAPWIDSGEVTIFTVDTIDTETWSNTNGDPRWRICRHEDWFRYLTNEMVPFIHAKMKEYQSDYTTSSDNEAWYQTNISKLNELPLLPFPNDNAL